MYTCEIKESLTQAMLQPFLFYVTGTKVHFRESEWRLVSKLMQTKKLSSKSERTKSNESNEIDAVFQSLVNCQETSEEDDPRVGELVDHLDKMDSSIQILKYGLEGLYGHLN